MHLELSCCSWATAFSFDWKVQASGLVERLHTVRLSTCPLMIPFRNLPGKTVMERMPSASHCIP